MIAIVENDSCSVDGIQSLTGCTFGKGNLIFRDWGKQVFTLAFRPEGRGVRLAFKGDSLKKLNQDGTTDREAFAEILQTAADEDPVRNPGSDRGPAPDGSNLPHSGLRNMREEGTMEPRLLDVNGQRICRSCLLKARSVRNHGPCGGLLVRSGHAQENTPHRIPISGQRPGNSGGAFLPHSGAGFCTGQTHARRGWGKDNQNGPLPRLGGSPDRATTTMSISNM